MAPHKFKSDVSNKSIPDLDLETLKSSWHG